MLRNTYSLYCGGSLRSSLARPAFKVHIYIYIYIYIYTGEMSRNVEEKCWGEMLIQSERNGPSPWETWTFEGRLEVSISNGSGIETLKLKCRESELWELTVRREMGVPLMNPRQSQLCRCCIYISIYIYIYMYIHVLICTTANACIYIYIYTHILS